MTEYEPSCEPCAQNMRKYYRHCAGCMERQRLAIDAMVTKEMADAMDSVWDALHEVKPKEHERPA